MVIKGQFVGLDWNRITRLHNQVITGLGFHLGLRFFSEFSLQLISCCCSFIFNILTLEVGWLHFDIF